MSKVTILTQLCIVSLRLGRWIVFLLLNLLDNLDEILFVEFLADIERGFTFMILGVEVDFAVLEKVLVHLFVFAVFCCNVEHVVSLEGHWRLICSMVDEKLANLEFSLGMHL